jgi:hypothetical protein
MRCWYLRHHHADEVHGLLEGLRRVDKHLVDVVAQVVAHGADDDVALLVQQHRRAVLLAGLADRIPQGQEVAEVPLQLLGRAAHAGGADDHAHAVGDLEAGQGLAQFGAVVALDASRDAPRTRVVGHQHHVAAGQADKGGQGRALVAALLLVDLDYDARVFLDDILDGYAAVAIEALLVKYSRAISLRGRKP